MKLVVVEEKILNAIAGRLSLEDFAQWFEEWFCEEADEGELGSKAYTILEELYSDIGYYEPDDEIRKEHSSYFDRDIFLDKLANTLEGISSG